MNIAFHSSIFPPFFPWIYIITGIAVSLQKKMKRSYEDCAGGLLSPAYTVSDIVSDALLEHERKYTSPQRKKSSTFQSRQFNNETIDSQEIVQVFQPFSRRAEFTRLQSILNHNEKYLVLLFFGVRNAYLELFSQYYHYLYDEMNIQLIGVSNHVEENSCTFPIITNNLKLIKANKALDPLGGGVYPRDVMVVYDLEGDKYKEMPIKFWEVNDGTIQEIVRIVREMELELML